MAQAWGEEQLIAGFLKSLGKKQGQILYNKYAPAFSRSYRDDNSIDMIIKDINNLENISSDQPLYVDFYYAPEKPIHPFRLRLYQWQQLASLSNILPMFENFGLRINKQRPYELKFSHQPSIWICDFTIDHTNVPYDLAKITDLFQHAFTQIYLGKAENDGLNQLVLAAAISWREVTILRAYAKYLRQVGFHYSQPYIEKTLVKYPQATKYLIELYHARFLPKFRGNRAKTQKEILTLLQNELNLVNSLDEDKIIHGLIELIKATLRTNFYQRIDHKEKDYLAFKLNSRALPDLPLPVPLYEIFVYSPRFEAIHLRNTKVARGGLRWSDRVEDFRTEVLGLMKAQTVKNALIVPSGAKGGFVLKQPTEHLDREALRAEVITCYQLFISGLLDLTDNIHAEEIIPPKDVVTHDEHDPYLVVAADKGTASFSDIANKISQQYHFWLGDAFASGGSAGYDHKKIAITARGAWESVKRHFQELNHNIQTELITTIGIGDMSGDVFGNAMLYSKNIKLVAAFDHRHIFIDPDPDIKKAFLERKRLFKLANSAWSDYDSSLISKGGGVFDRRLKTINLSAQMKQLLAINDNALTPNDLIKAILKAPVDLLFNGGIGTFVKASNETMLDAGDRTNDYCRINGNEIRVKVVGEGGNLGITQRGRIEYAQKGGLINTDFIDNSAGVNCSDHEVNLKILLTLVQHNKKLTMDKRNVLLASLTDEIAQLVLQDNYQQALLMSYSAYYAVRNFNLHISYIKELEHLQIINRQIEFLPDDKTLLERKTSNMGLTRPELAILISYTKIHLQHEILKSSLPEDPYLEQNVSAAFPKSISQKYPQALLHHRLRREIIATQLSNHVVNDMGLTFVYRIQLETGATVENIIRAHTVATHIFGTTELQQLICNFDFKMPVSEQYEIMFHIRRLVTLATRWFINSSYLNQNLEQLINTYRHKVQVLENLIPNFFGSFTQEQVMNLQAKLLAAGLPKVSAKRIAVYRTIYTALNIIDVSNFYKFDLEKTAHVYFLAGERLNLVWFRDQLSNDSRDGHWNAMARLTLRDQLDDAQRNLTVAIINTDPKETHPLKLVDKWIANNQRAFERWEKILSMLHTSSSIEYTMFFIALRELMSILTVRN